MTASLDGPVARQKTLPALGIEPGVLVVDAFLALDVEVALVGFGELLRGHAEEPVVDIHELRPSSVSSVGLDGLDGRRVPG